MSTILLAFSYSIIVYDYHNLIVVIYIIYIGYIIMDSGSHKSDRICGFVYTE